uniref:DDE Tnp4 domain-containing protein n=1 Tax=Cajanus cajan TaxID=3821 RepID=A0A151SEU9_CAJCA|nr:hypothetical protein KK1_024704 [Cajanus cajan]
MYVLSGWEGLAHDSKLLNDSIIRRNGLKVTQGVKYHLQDFASQVNDPKNEKEFFNLHRAYLRNVIKKEFFNLHRAYLRNVIKKIFGTFKSRFTIFKSTPPFLFKTQVELVLACATLHNFLHKECHYDEFSIELVD